MKSIVGIVVSIAAALCVSCQSIGSQFNHQNRTQLTLGETTRAQAIDLIGDGGDKASVSNADGDYDKLAYLYAEDNFGQRAGRALLLEFRDGVLNGYAYSSAFEEDSTSFEYEAGERIEIGATRMADVLTMLGEPPGKIWAPSTLDETKEEGAVEAWTWTYISSTDEAQAGVAKMTSLVVWFDESGVVCDLVRERVE